MKSYKLDRTAFKVQTFKEADMANVFDKEVPYSERLKQAWFLISQAYSFPVDNPPRLDRTTFSMRKFN